MFVLIEKTLRSLNHQANWHPRSLREQAAFHAALAPVGGIGPGFFPHPMGLWSSPRPSRASPNRSRRVPQTARFLLSTAEEDSCFHPLLKAIMRRRVRAQLCLIEVLRLEYRSQDAEDGVCTISIGHSRSSTAKAMGIHLHRQQWLEHCPQFIGNSKSRRRPIIRYSLPFSFLGFLFAHTPYCSRLFG